MCTVVYHYTSHGIVLQSQDNTKYLGVTLVPTLDWNTYIRDTSGKAIQQNPGFHPPEFMESPQENQRDCTYIFCLGSLHQR